MSTIYLAHNPPLPTIWVWPIKSVSGFNYTVQPDLDVFKMSWKQIL